MIVFALVLVLIICMIKYWLIPFHYLNNCTDRIRD